MKIRRHFGTERENTRREAQQIRKMIVELDCIAQMLDCSIAAEELRARVSDPSNFAYPITAKAMAARRDNLRTTIAALEKRLADIQKIALDAAAAIAA